MATNRSSRRSAHRVDPVERHTPIERLALSPRILRALGRGTYSEGAYGRQFFVVRDVDDLLVLGVRHLRRIRGIGRASIEAIRDEVARGGFTLTDRGQVLPGPRMRKVLGPVPDATRLPPAEPVTVAIEGASTKPSMSISNPSILPEGIRAVSPEACAICRTLHALVATDNDTFRRAMLAGFCMGAAYSHGTSVPMCAECARILERQTG